MRISPANRKGLLDELGTDEGQGGVVARLRRLRPQARDGCMPRRAGRLVQVVRRLRRAEPAARASASLLPRLRGRVGVRSEAVTTPAFGLVQACDDAQLFGFPLWPK